MCRWSCTPATTEAFVGGSRAEGGVPYSLLSRSGSVSKMPFLRPFSRDPTADDMQVNCSHYVDYLAPPTTVGSRLAALMGTMTLRADQLPVIHVPHSGVGERSLNPEVSACRNHLQSGDAE